MTPKSEKFLYLTESKENKFEKDIEKTNLILKNLAKDFENLIKPMAKENPNIRMMLYETLLRSITQNFNLPVNYVKGLLFQINTELSIGQIKKETKKTPSYLG